MRIVVYDCGWGGDAFANLLETEIPTIEVERVIDWRHAPYCKRSENEIRRLAEEALAGFIGKVDAIVLASYEITVSALKFLRMKYPDQVFIGMSWPILRDDTRQVVVMTTNLVRKSRSFRRTRRRLPGELAVQLCDDWMQAVDDGDFQEHRINEDAARTRRLHPQVVVLGCTNLVDIRPAIEQAYRGAFVVDGYKATIRNLCRTLKIKASVSRGI